MTIETRTIEIAAESCEASRVAGRKRFLAAMRGEFMGTFITVPCNASPNAMTDSEQALRLDAVAEARTCLASDGFIPSEESEDLARRFVTGEFDRIKFSGYRHASSTDDHS